MYCDFYERKKVFLEVGVKAGDKRQACPDKFKDDKELLAYLMSREQLADEVQAVSLDSPTSD